MSAVHLVVVCFPGFPAPLSLVVVLLVVIVVVFLAVFLPRSVALVMHHYKRSLLQLRYNRNLLLCMPLLCILPLHSTLLLRSTRLHSNCIRRTPLLPQGRCETEHQSRAAFAAVLDQGKKTIVSLQS